MKKFIQILSALLLSILILAGISSGNAVGEKHAAIRNETGIIAESKNQLIKAGYSQRNETDQNAAITQETVTGSAIEVKPVDPGKPMVALTFDDGPHPKYTLEIAEALKKNGAVATFFVLGSRAEKYKSTITAITENGNEIGNHTYSHRELTELKNAEIFSEINKTADILEAITGSKPIITRPTYGSMNKNVRLYAGSPLILWSVDTLDWKSRNKKEIVHKTLSTVKDGDIILMHDIYKTTAEAAVEIIGELRARGYQMVTINQLYQARGIPLENGKAYFNCVPSN
jgi:peptidoglycan/xylan/chitin deacetylase (PgdA/CDA1 family)